MSDASLDSDDFTALPDLELRRREMAAKFAALDPHSHLYEGKLPTYEFDEAADQPLFANQRRMYILRHAIMNKPDWQRKIQDDSIRANWRKEARNQVIPLPDGQPVREQDADIELLSLQQVDYVLDWLAWHAKNSEILKKGIKYSCYEGVFERDDALDSDFCARFEAAVHKLEDVPDEEKDWHPNTDMQVLDLVHPSLYPIMYGRTLARDDEGEMTPLVAPEKVTGGVWDTHSATSDKFCWLPTDFAISEDYKAQALSYINNLEPRKHPELHRLIEDVVGRVVPMWEHTLHAAQNESHHPMAERWDSDWFNEVDFDWEAEEGRLEDYDLVEEKYESLRSLHHTGPKDNFKPEDSSEGRFELAGSTIQVIVKLANIHLTPEKPKYEGGTWHVEGMSNEHIVASAIWYYDKDNIKDDTLVFRRAWNVEEFYDYEQNDNRGLEGMYAMNPEQAPGNQYVGTVSTTENKILVWPNTLQHRVPAFALDDASRPGHRKILALFLVNPTSPIPSTTHIAPQQLDWFKQDTERLASALAALKIPEDVLNLIDEQADLMTLAEAKEKRLELMKERTFYVNAQNTNEWEAEFNLCEH